MVMFCDFGSLVMKAARHSFRIIRFNPKRTGHAKMADDRKPIVEMHREIFCAPPERVDVASGQTLNKVIGKRETEIRPVLLDPFDFRAFHERLQTAANRFDLR